MNTESTDKEYSFTKWQKALASFCRKGEGTSIPGITSVTRLRKYRELILGLINDTLSSAYPITKEVLERREWEVLVKEFFANHPSSTPYLWQLPKEVLLWYEDSELFKDKYPFLYDLLLFEWAEIEVHLMPDVLLPKIKKEGDLLRDVIVINPYIKVLFLTYPVYRYTALELKNSKDIDPAECYLLVVRDIKEHTVSYCEAPLEAIKASGIILEKRISLEECLQRALLTEEEVSSFKKSFRALKESSVILGYN